MNEIMRATRQAMAEQRIVAAAEAWGEQNSAYAPQLDALKAIQVKDKPVKTMLQMEAIADLLEAMAGIAPAGQEPVTPEPEGVKANKPAQPAAPARDVPRKK